MAIGTLCPQGGRGKCRQYLLTGTFRILVIPRTISVPEVHCMASRQQGITLVELVVIICIAGVLLLIAVPKFMETVTKEQNVGRHDHTHDL